VVKDAARLYSWYKFGALLNADNHEEVVVDAAVELAGGNPIAIPPPAPHHPHPQVSETE